MERGRRPKSAAPRPDPSAPPLDSTWRGHGGDLDFDRPLAIGTRGELPRPMARAWPSRPPSKCDMTEQTTPAGCESPARRLGILYIASLSAVGLLAVVSQTYVLRELDSQAQDLRLVGIAASRGVGGEV